MEQNPPKPLNNIEVNKPMEDLTNNFKNILVLAPHTDDGELGAGAFIAKLIENNKTVTYVAFSSCQDSIPSEYPKDILVHEVKKATKSLGIQEENLHILDYKVREFNFSIQKILDDIINIKNENTFDLVLIPSLNDIHQDHSVIAVEAVRAFKNISILGYEHPWNHLKLDANCFIELEERHVLKKIESLSCYKSQGTRNYMTKDGIFSMAKTEGIKVGLEYAESFSVIRLFL